MTASNMDLFHSLLWKSFMLEMDKKSRYVWNVVINGIIGFILGIIIGNISLSKNKNDPTSAQLFRVEQSFKLAILYIVIFFRVGFIGRQIALNLVRDRRIKFRLTLQLLGVNQLIYIISNVLFSLIYGAVQVFILFFSMYATTLMIPTLSVGITSDTLVEFIVSTFGLFLAVIGIFAAFSAFIRQYDYSSEIVDKYSFMLLFVPVTYMCNQFLMLLRGDGSPDSLQSLSNATIHVNLFTLIIPTYSFLQIVITTILLQIFPASYIEQVNMNPEPVKTYNMIAIGQTFFYLTLYYLLDRYYSNDTGSHKSLFNSTSSMPDMEATLGDANTIPLAAAGQNYQPRSNLRMLNLVKKFGDFTAVNDVSLEIESGGVTCLLGHNGAGKTTIIDMMTGFQVPTSGAIYLNGNNIHQNSDHLYGKVGYASSHDPLFDELSVEDFLILIAKLRGFTDARGEALRVGHESNLVPFMFKKIRECSGGTKRRVSIASAMIGSPQIIFLDEPSTGVDPENRRALWEMIKNLKRPDRLIFLTTHHLEEAEFLSNDVIILSKGQVSVRGTPEQIKSALGCGYKFVLTNLFNGLEQQVYEDMRPFSSGINYNRVRINAGELSVDLKSSDPELSLGVLKTIVSRGYTYSIQAATLEDAFITLGEREETPEMEKRRDDIISFLFTRKFTPDVKSKILALMMRKFILLFRSMIQIMVILMLILVPTSLFYLIMSSQAYDYVNRKKSQISMNNLGTLNIICIIYYSITCGFFGMVPTSERITRVRYLLKMNNVNWKLYIPTLLVPDMIISLLLVFVTYFTAYFTCHDMYTNFDSGIFFSQGIFLWMFLSSFLAQSYCISFIFSNKDKAAKYLSTIYTLVNLLGLYIIFIINSKVLDQSTKNHLLYTMNFIFPGPSNLYYNAVSNSTNMGKYEAENLKKKLTEMIVGTIGCFIIFISIAIILDYFNTKISIADCAGSGTVPPGDVFDPTTVAAEINLAMRTDPQYPIQLQQLYKRFGDFYALSGVNLTLRQGEVLGLIGPNGAGKSTTFNIVSNHMSPTYGSVKYAGNDLGDYLRFYDEAGLCAQDDIIWPELTVDHHLSIYSKLKGVDAETVNKWKELMDLLNFGSFNTSHLSTGMKRKLCYIISMISNPTYKFLDEPTSGLDPVSRKLMRNLITAQKRAYGGSCVFTTHTMKDAEDLCDRVAIIVNGKVATVDTPTNLRAKAGGLNVTFHRNPTCPSPEPERQALINLFIQTFPECLDYGQPIITDTTEHKIVFFAQRLQNLPQKMETLYSMKSQGYIVDFEVSQRSLEDLFLFLARIQSKRHQS
jgi:ATP-binding cassette, subfamily A (ABC1), member 3